MTMHQDRQAWNFAHAMVFPSSCRVFIKCSGFQQIAM